MTRRATVSRGRGPRRTRRRAAILALAMGAALGACGGDGTDGADGTDATAALVADPIAPVLLVGVDGMDWAVLAPLVRSGRCPNIEALMREGSYGRLATLTPTLSPILWTTIATGRSKGDHGVTGFLDRAKRPYTSDRRGVRALWNVADRYGLSSSVFGWWITWPVEPIRGVMVSASSNASDAGATWKPALLPDAPHQVHPPELEDRVLAIAERVGTRESVTRLAVEKVYGPVPDAVLTKQERQLIVQSNWTIQADETFFRVALELMPERPADLTMIYLAGPDVVGHRFWRHYEPEVFAYGSHPDAVAALADTIPNYYVWVDEMLGELRAAAPEGATVLLVSDHGMHAENTQRPDDVTMKTGDHLDGPAGVFVAAGPGIAASGGIDRFLDGRGGLPIVGTVLDVAPLVLALLGIPPARELEGRAPERLLTESARVRAALPPVDSHDVGYEPAPAVALPSEMSRNFKQRFAQLGYLDLDVDPDDEERLVRPPEDPTTGGGADVDDG